MRDQRHMRPRVSDGTPFGTGRAVVPVVAIAPAVDIGTHGPRYRVNSAYVNALSRAGLLPVVIPPLGDPGQAEDALLNANGLVLTGGLDVDPALYGEKAHETTDMPTPLRDAWERALVHAAMKREIPTLAICRGLQLVNVALGGSLIQDIPSQCPDALHHGAGDRRSERLHPIAVSPESRLARLLQTERLSVNSAHHQALLRLAPQLIASAVAPDGIVEGAEWRGNDWWMVGVQWHPEDLIADQEPWDRNLFDGFASAVRGEYGPAKQVRTPHFRSD